MTPFILCDILPTGLKKRVMIACVTFETTKITDPVMYYEANKLHLIHYQRPGPKSEIYGSFYNRVVEIVEGCGRDVEIVEHNEKVYDFSTMLRTVLAIIQAENSAEYGCDIYVNISSGTSEYAAASAIASMMVPGTIPFTVRTDEFTVSSDKIEETYFVDGKPVGLTKTTRGNEAIPCYSIHMPEENLVRGLRLLDRMDGKPTSGKMVRKLQENGLWFRRTEEGVNKRQSEAVYYQRDYVNKWLNYGWIEKNRNTGWYQVTDSGRIILNTFFVD